MCRSCSGPKTVVIKSTVRLAMGELMAVTISRGRLLLPEVSVDSDFDTHAPSLGIVHVILLPNTPATPSQVVARLNDHLADQLPLLHESGT